MKKRINNVTVGADPELFLIDVDTKKYISAEGLIGGTKHEPTLIGNDGHAVQEDNVMAEFCIPPSLTKKEFVKHNKFMINWINAVLPNNITTKIVTTAIFDWDQLQTPQAMLFGCEPDYDVWTRNVNEAPDANNINFRSAGGHIHIGYDNPDNEVSEKLIKILDIYLGIPLSIMDNDKRRKQLYGKAGCFRFKEYGLEYRTPSNFWLSSEEMIGFAFDRVIHAIDLFNNGFDPNPYKEKIIDIINNDDLIKGQDLIHELNIVPQNFIKKLIK